MPKSLATYKKKRNFKKTPEPKPVVKKTPGKKFVVQKHDASRLHYDFRLEISGVLKSWAVPKGPSTATQDKRLAVLTEDHPMAYGNFEGVIPEGEYGAGIVIVWDRGTYRNLKKDKTGKAISMEDCFKKGRIEIALKGKKLKGAYALVRFREKNWLLIKMKDEHADGRKNITKSEPRSVKSNLTIEELKKKKK